MTDTKPGTHLTAEELKAISGGHGDCTPQEWVTILDGLKRNYETLIDFTSYMIERVNGGQPTP